MIEKRIKHNGAFLNYFSDNLLQVIPAISAKKSIKAVEQTAQKIADNFHQGDFQFQSKVKSAIFNNLEEDNELSQKKLADQLFDNNLTARLNFVDQLKEVIPDKISFERLIVVVNSRNLKPKTLSNGIELIVPNAPMRC